MAALMECAIDEMSVEKLKGLKVVELRQMLKDMGMRTSGKKDILVERLLEARSYTAPTPDTTIHPEEEKDVASSRSTKHDNEIKTTMKELQALTVPKLKQRLKAMNLETHGKKEALVRRIFTRDTLECQNDKEDTRGDINDGKLGQDSHENDDVQLNLKGTKSAIEVTGRRKSSKQIDSRTDKINNGGGNGEDFPQLKRKQTANDEELVDTNPKKERAYDFGDKGIREERVTEDTDKVARKEEMAIITEQLNSKLEKNAIRPELEFTKSSVTEKSEIEVRFPFSERIDIESRKSQINNGSVPNSATQVQVDNLQMFSKSPDSIVEILKWTFSHYGEVYDIKLVKDYELKAFGGSAIVYMTSKLAADAAVKALNQNYAIEGATSCWIVYKEGDMEYRQQSNTNIYGNNIGKAEPMVAGCVDNIVDQKPATVFVTNLSVEADEFAVNSIFSKFGSVRDLKIFKERESGKSRGIGLVSFEQRWQAKLAIQTLNGLYSMPGANRPLGVKWDKNSFDGEGSSNPIYDTKGREKRGKQSSFSMNVVPPAAQLSRKMPYSGPINVIHTSTGERRQDKTLIVRENGYFGADVAGLPPSAAVDKSFAHLYG